MRRTLALLLALSATPAFACDGGRLFDMLAAPPVPPADHVFDVAEIDSTEGGEWQVWRGSDGRAAVNIVRTDYGEGGRFEARIAVASAQAYAVTTTRFIYSAPNYVAGSITIREEKDIYVWCAGKLLLPEGFGPDQAYVDAAAEALEIFSASEVRNYVAGLER
ncbi:MAG: hypothetical protein KF723_08520 [Rhizobiaceae bacterium]|nr:hypothetical protein [Rhizobiaceae bacterium]